MGNIFHGIFEECGFKLNPVFFFVGGSDVWKDVYEFLNCSCRRPMSAGLYKKTDLGGFKVGLVLKLGLVCCYDGWVLVLVV